MWEEACYLRCEYVPKAFLAKLVQDTIDNNQDKKSRLNKGKFHKYTNC